jgi:CHAT domain-containing protein
LYCPGLLVVIGIALAIGGCRRAASPDTALLHIREEARRGQLDAALHDTDIAIARYQPRDPEWAARFRVQKAHILMLQGSYSESLTLLNEPLPPSLSRSDTEIQRKMVQGLSHDFLQQFDAADRNISEAEALASILHSSLRGDVAQARGTLELDRRKYPEAAVAFRNVLAFAQHHNQPFLETLALGSLGNVSMWQEHYDEAIDWFKAALEKARALGSLSSESRALGNMGWNYSVVGDFDNAEASLAQAQSKAGQAGLTDNQTYWLNSLGEVYFRQRRYGAAEQTSGKALNLARGRDDKNTLTQCLNTLSEIELATGRFDLAEQHNQEAAAIENAGLDHFGVQYSQLIAGRIAAGKKQFSQAEAIFRKIIADPAVETPLKWQAESRLAQVYAAENQPAKAEREFRRAISAISKVQGSLQREEFRVSFLSSAIQFYDAYIDFLAVRGRTLDALSVADLSRARALAKGLSQPTDNSSQASSLDPRSIAARFHATLLFYSLGEQHSYLWLITPSNVTLIHLPPEQEISSLVKNYREALLNSPSDPLTEPDSAGAKLYAMLVAPATKLIPRNARVIIFPDGPLDTFNFDTLVVPSPKPHYWIEDVTITNANSLALLARSKSFSLPRNPNLLLIGDPVPADSAFPALPQAAAEISRVESYFPEKSRRLLTGPAATPAAYLQSGPERYAYLHFVTHGIASRLQPLESAVVLSPSGDSYKLYAREIITRPLHAYLVTISACNGAGNRAYAGEGLVGLSWAFLRAGAHHVISALWEVSDASTPQLMKSLYEGLHRGEDPAAALRNAKLSLLHSNSIYKKPFYWAPFQLYSGS